MLITSELKSASAYDVVRYASLDTPRSVASLVGGPGDVLHGRGRLYLPISPLVIYWNRGWVSCDFTLQSNFNASGWQLANSWIPRMFPHTGRFLHSMGTG